MTTRLIYLTSTPYTGSTLTSILLGSHPDIATISELTGVNPSLDVSAYRCSCGLLLMDCDFFKQVARKVDESGLQFCYQDFRTRYRQGNRIKDRLLYGSLRSSHLEAVRDSVRHIWPGTQQFIEEHNRYNQALIRAILDVTEKNTFLYASKDPWRIPFLARSHAGPIHVLHITRDVRAFANSYRKNSGGDVAKAAKRWVRSHRNVMRIAGNEKASYARFRYEDICGETESTIRKMYVNCNLSGDVEVRFAPREQHLIGNRMRLRSEVTVRLDESWRRELTPEEQTTAWNIGQELMREFGYVE